MNQFQKVSYRAYCEAIGGDADLTQEYQDIQLPQRATIGSAGYDFYAPFSFSLDPGEDIQFPTGIRVLLDPDKWLCCAPRSGLGFKYKISLANTIGVIDADYAYSDNEGQIGVKLCNNGDKRVDIQKGDAYMQGLILSYCVTDDDTATGIRNGGFGSTGR